MNYVKLLTIERPYQPISCHGAAVALGIGALATGVAGSIAGAVSQSSVNDEQIGFSREENEKNRSYNKEEAEIQRQWMHDEWLSQYEKQSEDWYRQLAAQESSQRRMFDYQAEYNLPSSQVRRLQSAGLNPAAVLGGQGSSGLVAASSGNYASLPTSVPSGGSVSGSAASAPSPLQPSLRAPQFDIGSLGSFLSDFAKAYKDNRMLRPEMDKVATEIGYMLSQQAGQDLSNAYSSLELFIKNRTKDAEIYQKFLDLGVTYNEMSLKGALADESAQKSLLAKEEALLARMKKKLTKEQYNQALFYTKHLNETFEMEMSVKRSEMAKNDASAYYFQQLGKTEDDIRQFKVDNQKLLNDWQVTTNKLNDNKFYVDSNTLKEQVLLMRSALENRGLLNDETKERIALLAKEGKWYEVRTILNPIVQQALKVAGLGSDATMMMLK